MADARDFGLAAGNTPAGNLTALRRAVASVHPGEVLRIPKAAGACVVDTSGGLSAAVKIDKPMTILLEGALRASEGTRRPNPPYLFHVAADKVTFEGQGELSGPGTVDDLNVHEENNFPGLVFVTGQRFSWLGPIIRCPPKVGIFLKECHDATVSGRWLGGVRQYRSTHTSYFGIRATGGGWHHIIDNQFGRDDAGGRLITAFFNGGDNSGATACTVRGNSADVHEKLAYMWGDHHDIADCRIVNAIQTDIIRLNGSHNRVHKVTANQVMGGVSIYDGGDNEVSDCVFTNVIQTGIYVAGSPSYHDGFDGTRVLGNRISADQSAGAFQDGILLYLLGSATNGVRIEGNEVVGFGRLPDQAQIRLETRAPYKVRGATIADNRLIGGRQAGIRLREVAAPILKNNIGRGLAGAPLLQIP